MDLWDTRASPCGLRTAFSLGLCGVSQLPGGGGGGATAPSSPGVALLASYVTLGTATSPPSVSPDTLNWRTKPG